MFYYYGQGSPNGEQLCSLFACSHCSHRTVRTANKEFFKKCEQRTVRTSELVRTGRTANSANKRTGANRANSEQCEQRTVRTSKQVRTVRTANKCEQREQRTGANRANSEQGFFSKSANRANKCEHCSGIPDKGKEALVIGLGNEWYKESVHDDLDSFFDKLQNGWRNEEGVITYFIPKLTEKEKKLVEEKNEDHLMS